MQAKALALALALLRPKAMLPSKVPVEKTTMRISRSKVSVKKMAMRISRSKVPVEETTIRISSCHKDLEFVPQEDHHLILV